MPTLVHTKLILVANIEALISRLAPLLEDFGVDFSVDKRPKGVSELAPSGPCPIIRTGPLFR